MYNNLTQRPSDPEFAGKSAPMKHKPNKNYYQSRLQDPENVEQVFYS